MTNGNKRDVHLVGSVGLSNAEEVFRSAGTILGNRITHIPDGETGIARSVWIQCQTPFFMLNPQLEMVAPDPDRPGAYIPARVPSGGIYAYTAAERFVAFGRLRPGVSASDVHFDNLGYADWAIESYGTFSGLKREGIIAPGTRFQVCIPSPRVILASRVLPEEIERVEPAYLRAIHNEIARLAAAVPMDELAIQWDCTEPPRYESVDEDERKQMVERLIRLSEFVPGGVHLGYHLCYGDFEHRHTVQPSDTGVLVTIANALAKGVSRPINWTHMPVPIDRSDEGYFGPLEELQLQPSTRLYLGLVHYSDGLEGAKKRMAAANTAVSEFGVATECGFGRRPKEQDIYELLKLHAEIVNL